MLNNTVRTSKQACKCSSLNTAKTGPIGSSNSYRIFFAVIATIFLIISVGMQFASAADLTISTDANGTNSTGTESLENEFNAGWYGDTIVVENIPGGLGRTLVKNCFYRMHQPFPGYQTLAYSDQFYVNDGETVVKDYTDLDSYDCRLQIDTGTKTCPLSGSPPPFGDLITFIVRSGDLCSTNSGPYCGDGEIQPPEVCEENLDCDDNNPSTIDTCDNCKCRYTQVQPRCGDGIINQASEQCELPNTQNNNFCSQSTSACSGNKTGYRDLFGNCNSVCGCGQDPFTFSCVKNSCGATCESDRDCPNTCNGNIRTFSGACGANSCSCSYQTENCDTKDGWYDTNQTRWIDFDQCSELKQVQKEYRDYSCAPQACTFTVTQTVWQNTTTVRSKPQGTVCNDNKFCTTNDQCMDGICGGTVRDCSFNSYSVIARCDNVPDSIFFTWDYSPGFISVCDEQHDVCTTQNRTYNHTCSIELCNAECESNADCDDGLPYTVDTCVSNCTCRHDTQEYCGDGIVQFKLGEMCELPNTFNNAYCPQRQSTCSGNFTGQRDAFGNCNSQCGCAVDDFVFSCVAGSCGAQCDSDDDCAPQCIGGIRQFSGECNLRASCSCTYQTEDCNAKDGWYWTNETRWISSDVCLEKEQKKKEYRDYDCAPEACTYSVTNSTWLDTGATRPKPDGTTCDDNLFCTTGDVCTQGVCGGGARDCSGNSYNVIARCDNIPDNIIFTWDYSPGFTSTCDEIHDICTSQNRTYTHECSVARCNAQCEDNNDCDDCDPNTIDICNGQCGCEHIDPCRTKGKESPECLTLKESIASSPQPDCIAPPVTDKQPTVESAVQSQETVSAAPVQETTSRRSGGGGGGSGGGSSSSGGSASTDSSWDCDAWSACDAGVQSRTCKAGIISRKEAQSCTLAAVPVKSGSSGNAPASTASGKLAENTRVNAAAENIVEAIPRLPIAAPTGEASEADVDSDSGKPGLDVSGDLSVAKPGRFSWTVLVSAAQSFFQLIKFW